MNRQSNKRRIQCIETSSQYKQKEKRLKDNMIIPIHQLDIIEMLIMEFLSQEDLGKFALTNTKMNELAMKDTQFFFLRMLKRFSNSETRPIVAVEVLNWPLSVPFLETQYAQDRIELYIPKDMRISFEQLQMVDESQASYLKMLMRYFKFYFYEMKRHLGLV
jgi:hypothetical protein